MTKRLWERKFRWGKKIADGVGSLDVAVEFGPENLLLGVCWSNTIVGKMRSTTVRMCVVPTVSVCVRIFRLAPQPKATSNGREDGEML